MLYHGATSVRQRLREIFDADDMQNESNDTSDEDYADKKRPSTISDGSDDDSDEEEKDATALKRDYEEFKKQEEENDPSVPYFLKNFSAD